MNRSKAVFRAEWERRLRSSQARYFFIDFSADLENYMRIGYALEVQRWGWRVVAVWREGFLIDTEARCDA